MGVAESKQMVETYKYEPGDYVTDPTEDTSYPTIWFQNSSKTWIASNSLSISGSLKYNDWIYIGSKHWWITRDVALVRYFEKHIREKDKQAYADQVQEQSDNFDVSHAEENVNLPWQVQPTAPADGSVPEITRWLPKARGGDVAFPFQTVVMTEIQKRNLLIADEMGLGKTIQAILAMNVLGHARPDKKRPFLVLVVAPNTMVLKWHVEIAKWGALPMEDLLYNVIPWSQITKEVKENPNKLYDLVIVDEAHYAKNSGSQRSQAFSKLKGKHRIALTGTPILARPSEVYPIVDWLEPMLLGTPSQFDSKYEVKYLARAGGRAFWRYSIDTQKVKDLQRKLRDTVMLARRKENVLPQLPPKQRSVVEIDFGQHVTELERKISVLFDELQLKGGHDMVLRNNLFALRHEAAILKVPMVNGFVEETWLDSQRPMVVFCHHKLVLEEIEKHMKLLIGDRVASISGKQTANARSLIVEQFQNGDYDILVAGLTVGGLGITLTAADVAIFAELDWTPANLVQAEDRLHRIGQENPVNIYYTVSQGSIDGKLAKVLGDKQEVIDAFNEQLRPFQK
jgi:SWI/SNF-related matrix-associated actin-dependent regulator 1 of chromatin subfamily A